MKANKKREVIVVIALLLAVIMALSLALMSISYGKTYVPSGTVAAIDNGMSATDDDIIEVEFDFGNPGLLRGTNNYIGDAEIDGTFFYIRIIVQDKLWPYRDNFEIQVWNQGNEPFTMKIDKAGFYWKSGTFQSCVTTDWTPKYTKAYYGPYYSDGTKEQKWAADYVEIKMYIQKGLYRSNINARFYVGRTEVEQL